MWAARTQVCVPSPTASQGGHQLQLGEPGTPTPAPDTPSCAFTAEPKAIFDLMIQHVSINECNSSTQQKQSTNDPSNR